MQDFIFVIDRGYLNYLFVNLFYIKKTFRHE